MEIRRRGRYGYHRVYVYFVQSGTSGPIKIGQTMCDFRDRLTSLQTSSVEKLHPLGILVATDQFNEKSLHARFAGIRLHGEWFSPTPTLLEFIATHAGQFDDIMSVQRVDTPFSDEEILEQKRRSAATLDIFVSHAKTATAKTAVVAETDDDELTDDEELEYLTPEEHISIQWARVLACKLIRDENLQGNAECVDACRRAGRAVKLALASLASPA